MQADLLTLVFAAGGAWMGVRVEIRNLRAEIEKIKRIVRNCPQHDGSI